MIQTALRGHSPGVVTTGCLGMVRSISGRNNTPQNTRHTLPAFQGPLTKIPFVKHPAMQFVLYKKAPGGGRVGVLK